MSHVTKGIPSCGQPDEVSRGTSPAFAVLDVKGEEGDTLGEDSDADEDHSSDSYASSDDELQDLLDDHSANRTSHGGDTAETTPDSSDAETVIEDYVSDDEDDDESDDGGDDEGDDEGNDEGGDDDDGGFVSDDELPKMLPSAGETAQATPNNSDAADFTLAANLEKLHLLLRSMYDKIRRYLMDKEELPRARAAELSRLGELGPSRREELPWSRDSNPCLSHADVVLWLRKVVIAIKKSKLEDPEHSSHLIRSFVVLIAELAGIEGSLPVAIALEDWREDNFESKREEFEKRQALGFSIVYTWLFWTAEKPNR